MPLAKESFYNRDLVAKAKKDGVKIVYDRFEEQQPQCGFGLAGICCRACFQGPCRIIPGKNEKGICGASADVIAARNLVRFAAAGATCHTDHAKEIVLALMKVLDRKTKNYGVKDWNKLRAISKRLGVVGGKNVVLEALEDFRRQEGLFHRKEGDYLNWLKINVPKERIRVWGKLDILPVSCDSETSHALHQTTMGNDADYVNLLKEVLRLGLVDGFGGLWLGTDMQDIIFGTPKLVKSEANLGLLKRDYVNIIVHGHVPLLSEKVVEWAKKKKVRGAKGVNVVGMCCTGNEVLMRNGVGMIGHVLQQEMALVTGLVDACVVDMQCIYPSLQDIASCYHTKLITTIDFVRIPGALHLKFEVENADRAARQIVDEGVKAYYKRDVSKIYAPNEKSKMIGGFSVECIEELLGRVNKRKPLKAVLDALKKKELRGIVAVVGCRNAKLRGMKFHEGLMKEMLKRDILVVATGCGAHAAAQEGLMHGQKYCGPGLKRFLKRVGDANRVELPGVWHMGSCIDNSRIARLFVELSESAGRRVCEMPFAVSAPEMAHEKCFSIGVFYLCLGLDVHVNPLPPVGGSRNVQKLLCSDLKGILGGRVLTGNSVDSAVRVLVNSLEGKKP